MRVLFRSILPHNFPEKAVDLSPSLKLSLQLPDFIYTGQPSSHILTGCFCFFLCISCLVSLRVSDFCLLIFKTFCWLRNLTHGLYYIFFFPLMCHWYLTFIYTAFIMWNIKFIFVQIYHCILVFCFFYISSLCILLWKIFFTSKLESNNLNFSFSPGAAYKPILV